MKNQSKKNYYILLFSLLFFMNVKAQVQHSGTVDFEDRFDQLLSAVNTSPCDCDILLLSTSVPN